MLRQQNNTQLDRLETIAAAQGWTHVLHDCRDERQRREMKRGR